MSKSGIEWTQVTWNPTAGCSIVSPGCTNCYAMRMANRIQHNPRLPDSAYKGVTKPSKGGPVWTGVVNISEPATMKPLGWKKPKFIFVNSMSDVFHESLTAAQIARIWAVMAIASQHSYQVLTKRPQLMLQWLSDPSTPAAVELAMQPIKPGARLTEWPLSHVWSGTSTEDHTRAKERISTISQVPASIRFLSMEPLLGGIDLRAAVSEEDFRKLNWVIVGGESGPGSRPMHPQWAREIRDVCVKHGVKFFFKQVGSWAWVPDDQAKRWVDVSGRVSDQPINGWQGIRYGSKKSGGRELDGRLWEQMPDFAANQHSNLPSFDLSRLAS